MIKNKFNPARVASTAFSVLMSIGFLGIDAITEQRAVYAADTCPFDYRSPAFDYYPRVEPISGSAPLLVYAVVLQKLVKVW